MDIRNLEARLRKLEQWEEESHPLPRIIVRGHKGKTISDSDPDDAGKLSQFTINMSEKRSNDTEDGERKNDDK